MKIEGTVQTINDQDRIELARAFVSLHKNANLDDWRLNLPCDLRFYSSDDKALLEIYTRMVHGVYSGNNGADTDQYGEFCIEISRFETASGHTKLFDWEDEQEYRLVSGMDGNGW